MWHDLQRYKRRKNSDKWQFRAQPINMKLSIVLVVVLFSIVRDQVDSSRRQRFDYYEELKSFGLLDDRSLSYKDIFDRIRFILADFLQFYENVLESNANKYILELDNASSLAETNPLRKLELNAKIGLNQEYSRVIDRFPIQIGETAVQTCKAVDNSLLALAAKEDRRMHNELHRLMELKNTHADSLHLLIEYYHNLSWEEFGRRTRQPNHHLLTVLASFMGTFQTQLETAVRRIERRFEDAALRRMQHFNLPLVLWWLNYRRTEGLWSTHPSEPFYVTKTAHTKLGQEFSFDNFNNVNRQGIQILDQINEALFVWENVINFTEYSRFKRANLSALPNGASEEHIVLKLRSYHINI